MSNKKNGKACQEEINSASQEDRVARQQKHFIMYVQRMVILASLLYTEITLVIQIYNVTRLQHLQEQH